MQDIASLPTERISDDEHKLALRLLRDCRDSRETGAVTVQGDIATEETRAKPSRSYVLIPVPVRTNAPNTAEILRLCPRSYKHVFLLVDGKRSAAEITFMIKHLGELVVLYIIGQFETA